MRVLAINQFYAPDISAGSQILTELCEGLVAAGDEVTVVASRGTYLGGRRLPAREVVNGVQVVRAWATGFGKASIAGRLSDYSTFWASAIVSALRQPTVDVVLAVTTPPLIAAAAALVARARRVPLVTWTQDVYPEVAVAFGFMRKDSMATKLLLKIQRRTHLASDRIVAISPGMGKRLEAQGAPSSRIRVVPNWSDGSQIQPRDPATNAFRRDHGLRGFVAMYSGNLGVAHEFETIMGAARILAKTCPDVQFLFIGDGQRRAEAVALASGLENVRFLPYQPKAMLGESLTAADAHLMTLRDGLDGLVVPSKFYGAIASGRPVFYVGPQNCEVAHQIRTAEIGWTGRPNDVDGLAAAIARAAQDSAWSAQCGCRARQLFDEECDRPIAVRRWRNVLGEAVTNLA
jgi:colanic acid biosynthesis glycosyl transferase WcaI